ncbi:MAG: beta-ketoacyl-[acyl-carrier-protein] synthase family protein [Desulfobulbaceae bacterium]
MTVTVGEYRAAVTGMGGCCAAGRTMGDIAVALEAGVVNCGPVPEEIFHSKRSWPVFAVPDFRLSSRTVELLAAGDPDRSPASLNRTALLLLEATGEALADAGIDMTALHDRRVGIAVGTTVGCTFNDEEYYIAWRRGERPDTGPVRAYLESNLALLLQRILGVRGPAAVVTNACASGTDAVGIGRSWLARGECDIVLAGGADALSRIAYFGFGSLMLLSESPCTPFDRDRAGLNLGEGAALLVMETPEAARRRNARTRGSVRGYGAASDCYHPTAPHPEGRGLCAALSRALDDAGVPADAISFINAHGTGTPANDIAEMRGLAAAGLTGCPVVSTKGITGHMLGAAGAMEAALTIHVLAEGRCRGTVGCSHPDPDLAGPVVTGKEEANLRGAVGISQSLAFGGTNAALVLEVESR